jgi:hypothetical protein
VSILEQVEERIGERRFEIRIGKQGSWRTVQDFEGSTPATQCYGVDVERAADFAAEGHGSAVKHLVQLVREELRQRIAGARQQE